MGSDSCCGISWCEDIYRGGIFHQSQARPDWGVLDTAMASDDAPCIVVIGTPYIEGAAIAIVTIATASFY